MGILDNTDRQDRGGASEEEQVRVLFDAYFDRLTYFAFRLLKDRDLASDMAQEAFIKYWQARYQVGSHPVAMRNFLYTTVKNSCLNHIRHEKVVSDYASQTGEESIAEGTAMDAMITAEVLHSLEMAIRSLPESYRRISTMAYLEGKKNGEIADLLQMSVNTVKKQKQRALELLRLRLAPELLALIIFLHS